MRCSATAAKARFSLLSTLVEEAANRGHTRIKLHAAAQGNQFFRSFGFTGENVDLTPLVDERE